jgi:hypothetical protein
MCLKRRFFVVVHAQTGKGGLLHVLSSIRTCMKNGADGAFLIPDYERGDAKASARDVMEYYIEAKRKFPKFKIGVNFLGEFDQEVISFLKDQEPDMIQTDSKSLPLGVIISKKTEVFCGVAFKYSRYEGISGKRLREHCLEVSKKCDVPTTSGSATGVQANFEKVQKIRNHLGKEKRLALASGIDIANILTYLGIGVTDLLVATSLIDLFESDMHGFDMLNPRKVAMMAEIIHG